MADSVLTEVSSPRPLKIPKLEKACEVSSSKEDDLRYGTWEDDEYLRQYLQFYYQYHKTEGFTIDWDQFDFFMNTRSLDRARPLSKTKSNAERIHEQTLFAIEKHNEATVAKLVFVEHIEANYKYVAGLLYWLTFWARDVSSSTPESKIYQAKVWRRGTEFQIPIFRLKPTEQEIDSIEVQPPSPMRDFENPPIMFSRAGPEDGVPFVFDRTGAGFDPDYYCSSP
ncbi:hypothetical protein AALP_AA8G357200 [Arabis alpina]|uniref:Cystatin domain-containing protein n=1 Tax=Arabis alpina TaxID=50452 RepID=A0A087GBJ4_ARAAL|nr:hypothetical protein AALP_AA8G357200 [Arabis alpina]